MRKLLIVWLVASTGCFSYVPAGDAVLSRGTPVRARLSVPTDFRLAEISLNNTTQVSGELVRQDADTLVLSATALRSQTGYSVAAAGETVAIPAERLARVERRRFDVLRSVLLVAAAYAFSSLVFVVVDRGGAGDDPIGEPIPTPQWRGVGTGGM